MPRKKKVIVVAPLETDLEAIMKDYHEAEVGLKAVEAQLDTQITKAKDSLKPKIEALKAQKEAAFQSLEAFAIANPDKFKKRRSMSMIHGKFGLRTGSWKLVFGYGKKKIAAAIVEGLTFSSDPDADRQLKSDLLRVKKEINAEAIIERRNDARIVGLLRDAGIDVVQEETFFVDAEAIKIE